MGERRQRRSLGLTYHRCPLCKGLPVYGAAAPKPSDLGHGREQGGTVPAGPWDWWLVGAQQGWWGRACLLDKHQASQGLLDTNPRQGFSGRGGWLRAGTPVPRANTTQSIWPLKVSLVTAGSALSL